MYEYFELFLAMGVAWSISGIIIFSRQRRRSSPDSPYAILVIVVFLLSILDNLLRPELIPMSILRHIYPLTRLSYFLIGPALWLYVRVLLIDDFKVSKRTLLHMIPFVIWFIYIMIDPASIHPKVRFAEEVGEVAREVSPLFSFSFFWVSTKNLSRLLYSAAILLQLRQHNRGLRDRVSNLSSRYTLSWISYLVIFYTGIYLLNSLVNVVLAEESLFYQVFSAVGRSLPAVLGVFFFSNHSSVQPILAEKEETSEEPSEEPEQDSSQVSPKYEKSGLSEIESRALYTALTSYIGESKIYLDTELTLDTLAEKMGETRHRLSEVINRESGKRFFSFINTFRLQEFQEVVRKDTYPDYTIIAIAFECGFGSSSAFYSMVKKELGTTPKALVRELQSGLGA